MMTRNLVVNQAPALRHPLIHAERQYCLSVSPTEFGKMVPLVCRTARRSERTPAEGFRQKSK